MDTSSTHRDEARQSRTTLLGPEAVELLQTGEMQVVRLVPWSSNYTFVAQVEKANLTTLAVYKPRRGERPLWDFPTGSLYRREVAAFVVSDALGWGIVPPTVTRSGEHGIGMVQLFIEHDPEEHFFTFRDPWPDELTRIALFDVLANNADRKGGHCLRDGEGRIWSIDHGICFHAEPKLRTVIWEMAGEPIPENPLADLRCLQTHLLQHEPPSDALSKLLSQAEIAALKHRLARLVEKGRFPQPPAGRRYVPWPMI
ncbi:MAG: SCO1664 family protein [Ardenticatenaceae bacterium]